ncbi:plasma membrane proteolipid Pmp3 [Coemansia sp. RSA 1836]
MSCRNATDLMLLILAFFLPPLAVFFKRGCTADLLINVCLTLLGYLPGMVHAWYLILKYPYTAARV